MNVLAPFHCFVLFFPNEVYSLCAGCVEGIDVFAYISSLESVQVGNHSVTASGDGALMLPPAACSRKLGDAYQRFVCVSLPLHTYMYSTLTVYDTCTYVHISVAPCYMSIPFNLITQMMMDIRYIIMCIHTCIHTCIL